MNRNVYFNSPFLLGFEHLDRLLERTAKAAGDGYPPYNIEQSEDESLRITLRQASLSDIDEAREKIGDRLERHSQRNCSTNLADIER